MPSRCQSRADHYRAAEKCLADADKAGDSLAALAGKFGDAVDSRIVEQVGLGVDRTLARGLIHATLAAADGFVEDEVRS